MRELRRAFEHLDQHREGEVGRNELLASLDCGNPGLMAYLKTRHFQVNEAGAPDSGEDGRSQGAPVKLSLIDAIEASNEEFVAWREVSVGRRYSRWGRSIELLDLYRRVLPLHGRI